IVTILDAKQDRGNIFKTQSKETPNEPISQGTSSGGGPRCHESMSDVVAQTRSERVSKISNDLLLVGVNIPRSARVESSEDEGLGEVDASKQGRISDIDADDDITLVSTHNEQMFDVDQDLHGEGCLLHNKMRMLLKMKLMLLKFRKPKRKDTKVPWLSIPTSVADEAVNEEMDDSLERAATIVTILDAKQDRGNIFKTQSKETPNEPISQGTSSGGGPREDVETLWKLIKAKYGLTRLEGDYEKVLWGDQ
nr:hypothetical protein [Tanacetum cinerariifolium]